MKAKLFLLIFLYACAISNAQNYAWANGAGGSSNDNGNGIVKDAAGNEYVTGSFSSPTIAFGNITLTKTGTGTTTDMFIAKYDPLGNVIWAKNFGGTANDNGNKLATDSAANVYVIGEFASASIAFGSYTLTNTSPPTNDIFVVKLDSAGTVLWAQSSGGNLSDYGNDIVTDRAGNICITGYFYSSNISFGSTFIANLGNAGSSDMYLVKYDSSGNVLWARSSVGANNDAGLGLCADTSGNIYVTGDFYSPTFLVQNTTLTNAGPSSTSDAFIAKFDTWGSELWAISAGGTYYDFGADISNDLAGNIYATGSFLSGSITFGGITLQGAGASNNDIYVVKYTAAGNLLWAKAAAGIASDVAWGIRTNAVTGDAYIAGFFNSDTLWFGNTYLTNAGLSEVFVAKYDSAGNVVWVAGAGGTANDIANDICTDTSGNCYVTGNYASSTATFGAVSLANVGTSNTYDVFIGKIGSNSVPMGVMLLSEKDKGIMRIYPNPFSASATISISAKLNMRPAELRIYNVFGQEIRSIVISDNQIALNREDLKSGIYFVSLVQDNKIIASNKLIIAD